MLFSEKIKQLRLSSGKLQKDLAKAIGVDVPAYSRYEHGERRPKREQVLRLARIFKTDVDELPPLLVHHGKKYAPGYALYKAVGGVITQVEP